MVRVSYIVRDKGVYVDKIHIDTYCVYVYFFP